MVFSIPLLSYVLVPIVIFGSFIKVNLAIGIMKVMFMFFFDKSRRPKLGPLEQTITARMRYDIAASLDSAERPWCLFFAATPEFQLGQKARWRMATF